MDTLDPRASRKCGKYSNQSNVSDEVCHVKKRSNKEFRMSMVHWSNLQYLELVLSTWKIAGTCTAESMLQLRYSTSVLDTTLRISETRRMRVLRMKSEWLIVDTGTVSL